jgi:thiol-disulfide isomerase/thioredoxin
MKFFFIILSLVCSQQLFAQQTGIMKVKKGSWIAQLELNDSNRLPFNIEISKKKKVYTFTVINGEERIILDQPVIQGDTIRMRFPFFNSEIVFHIENKKSFKGYWQNFNKGDNYRIPLQAKRTKKSRFESSHKSKNYINTNGRWEVAFEPGTSSEYPGVGIFDQEKNTVTGTFLTETGDYRFLDGNTVNDSLYLSCFDGTHAFLFKASLENDTLSGKFYSGSHWKSEWKAFKNDSIELSNPEELTYLKDSSTVEFELKKLDGSAYSFPNKTTENKVVIIQIMGSWCPNCLDETIYYKSLHNKYKEKGLEIISVCYEAGNSFEDHVKSVQRLQAKLDLDFTFLIGGNAQKKLAAEHFDMLNHIISFPTSIVIDRNGEVAMVHTGFNGPGTGIYYDNFVAKTNALIEYLLAQ